MARPLMRRRLTNRRRGDAVIEFALLAPTLLLLLFGILELGRVLDAWLIVENAAREGAREAAASPAQDPTSLAQQTTIAYLNMALAGRGDVAAIVVPTPQLDATGVAVSAEVDIQLYTPLFTSMLPSPLPVRATASMRRQ